MASPMIPPATAPAFLAAHGWAGATILPLAGDASFRRYFRVLDGSRRAVLMDAPPDKEDSRPFLAIGAHLHKLGFSAPQPLAVDLDLGLILLEDFGDARVNPLLAETPTGESEIYATAIDVLVELHHHPAPAIAPYGAAELRREVRLFPEWYLPAAGVAEAPGYDAAWDAVFSQILSDTLAKPVLTLRDYHADNLMLLDRPGLRGLGLLDYQDALAGHPAYDLVSLLQDARRDVAPELEALMLRRYTEAAGITNLDGFRAAYEILGAQRNTKILGVFTRLWKRDSKPAYPAFNPRVWGYLERNLAHPALTPVADWFAANVPATAQQKFETGA